MPAMSCYSVSGLTFTRSTAAVTCLTVNIQKKIKSAWSTADTCPRKSVSHSQYGNHIWTYFARSQRKVEIFVASKFVYIFNLKAHVWVQVGCPTSQLQRKYMWRTRLWHQSVWHPLRPVALASQVVRDSVSLSGLFLSLTVPLYL